MTDRAPVQVFRQPDFDMAFRVDDCTDPWLEPDTVLLLHGIAESNAAWYAWIPTLARHLRVIRPDLRGFGQSTPMARDFGWSLQVLVDDAVRLLDDLKVEACHVVGAKVGANIGRALAARHPARVRSLSLAGTPPAFKPGDDAGLAHWIAGFERDGVEPWARASMASRLGSAFPPAGVDWWVRFMGRTSAQTQIGFLEMVYRAPEFQAAAIDADLARIGCPTLVITTEGSGIAGIDDTRAWQQRIARSRLLVLPGDSYHVAASDAERCAAEVLAFIRSALSASP